MVGRCLAYIAFEGGAKLMDEYWEGVRLLTWGQLDP